MNNNCIYCNGKVDVIQNKCSQCGKPVTKKVYAVQATPQQMKEANKVQVASEKQQAKTVQVNKQQTQIKLAKEVQYSEEKNLQTQGFKGKEQVVQSAPVKEQPTQEEKQIKSERNEGVLFREGIEATGNERWLFGGNQKGNKTTEVVKEKESNNPFKKGYKWLIGGVILLSLGGMMLNKEEAAVSDSIYLEEEMETVAETELVEVIEPINEVEVIEQVNEVEEQIIPITENTDEKVIELVENYLSCFAQAVNKGDFSLVAPYLYPGSELYQTQSINVGNMHKVGIREQFLGYEITTIDYDSTTGFGTVVVYEKYRVEKQQPSRTLKDMDFINTYDFRFNEEEQVFQLVSLYL